MVIDRLLNIWTENAWKVEICRMGMKHGKPRWNFMHLVAMFGSWFHCIYNKIQVLHFWGPPKIASSLGNREAKEIRLIAHKKRGLPHNIKLREAIESRYFWTFYNVNTTWYMYVNLEQLSHTYQNVISHMTW